jgi:uncharacterized phage protein (TIGR01671 family)
MREIKFRTWAKKRKEMIHISDVRKTPYCLMLDLEGNLHDVAYNRDDEGDNVNDYFEIMRFTGLKDCEWKEIYEGDIIRHPHTGEHWICEFKTGGFWATHPKDRYSINIGLTEGFTVVGNIYENPELLN